MIRNRSGLVRRVGALTALVLALAGCGGGTSAPAAPKGTVSITIGANAPPSLGSFLPPIIKDQKFDNKHGLDLHFTYSANDAYNLSYTSGQLQVGASASLIQEALRWQNGIQSVYLFNTVDFWTGFLTKDPSIKTLADLQGKSVGTSLGTSNYALTVWFLQQAGVDVNKFKFVNLTNAAMGPALEAGQVAAIDEPEPGYDTVLGVDPNLHPIALNIVGIWKQKFNTTYIPFLGVAALPDWAASHKTEIQELYDTYKEAAAWAQAHIDQAAALIAKTIPGGQASVIQALFSNKTRMPLDVVPATDIKTGLSGVIDAGLATGYIKQKPGSSFLYAGLNK